MIAWRPAAAAMDQERFEVRPLIVGHQSANQGCPPQRAALNQFAILASIGLSTRPRVDAQRQRQRALAFIRSGFSAVRGRGVLTKNLVIGRTRQSLIEGACPASSFRRPLFGPLRYLATGKT
jgi:hypothetical protein